MHRWKSILLAVTVSVTAVYPTVAVFADTPAPSVEDSEKWARLKDQVMEYAELEDLIKEYNPAVQVEEDSYNRSISRKRELEKTLKDYADDLQQNVDDLKNAGVTGEMLEGAQMYANTIKNAANTTKTDIRNMESKTQTMAMEQARDSLSMTAQSMMISYNQSRLQQEVQAKNLELANARLASVQAKKSLGMATEAEVLTAEKNIKTIETQQTDLSNSLDQMRQNLCLMTGWGYNDHPDIQTIPPLELSEIDAINLEEDIKKAQSSNYTVRGYTKPGAAGSTLSQKEIHGRNDDVARQEVATKVESQYQTLLSLRTDYMAAQTAFEKAQVDMDSATRQYQLGMLSKEQYLQAELTYLQQKAACETANMQVFQALETYRWYVRGLLDLSMISNEKR